MEIREPAMAGTLESSDCQIVLRPNPGRGIEIDLDSAVKAMFGDSILETVKRTLAELAVTDASVEIRDRGALDCVIQARLQCAVCRGAKQIYDWAKEDR
ncbi:MAG: citrate lyase acyl carrier protein [Lachnospiraceae bacterium]|nr:citrate lyase acyl carrier protein [Lachnospiraceae bacterium]